MAALVRQVEQGRCPADDFSDRVVRYGHRGRGHRTGARGAVTSREMLADELTTARDRTLRLVDFDDAELRRQYDPLMSPLVWDLAHIGQQEELWLLRGGDPNRPGMLPPAVERPLRRVRALPRQPRRPAAAAAGRRAGVLPRPCGPRRSTPWTRCPTTTPRLATSTFGLVISHENQHDETMLQALNLRSGPAAAGPRRRRCRRVGRVWRARRCWCPAGRSSSASTPSTEPHSLDNERPAHVVDVPAFRIGRVPVTNGEWRQFIDDGGYAQPRWWSERGWAHRRAGRPDRAAVLERRRHPHPVRPRRGHSRRRARPARHLLRSRGLRRMGGRPAAHRGGVGEGLRVGSRRRHPASVPLGRCRTHRCAGQPRRRRAATRAGRRVPGRARRPTAPSRCSATCGSGPPRRCGRGRGSPR